MSDGDVIYPSGWPCRPQVGWLGSPGWVVLSLTVSRRSLYVQGGRAWLRWTFRPAILPDEEVE